MGIVRINQLPDGSGSLSSDDVFLFMDDPSNGGITKKISLNEIASAISTSANLISSDPSGIPGASGINNIVQISQVDYDALVTKDADTLYIIS